MKDSARAARPWADLSGVRSEESFFFAIVLKIKSILALLFNSGYLKITIKKVFEGGIIEL